MKRLCAVLLTGLVFSAFCFAQTQTGDASYNAAKAGLTLSHTSMSFNTRVRITNLRNNREVIATVDGRIAAAGPRIADISKEAADAIGMSPSGYTQVRLEQLPHVQAEPAPVAAAPPVAPAPPVTPAPSPTRAPAAVTPAAPPAPVPVPVVQESVVEAVQVISQPPQYLVLPPSGPVCPASPFCWVVLVLLALVVALLTGILVLLLSLRRIPWLGLPTPWYRPVWLRRHLRYLKRRRR